MSMTLNGEDTTQLRLPDGSTVDVFSGVNEHKNEPSSTDETGAGPLPKGLYFIVDRPSGGTLGPLRDWVTGRNKWFALFRLDGNIDDMTKVFEAQRSLFRMHPGSRSEGCVTFCRKEDFNRTSDMLKNSPNGKIPNTDITFYGTLYVD